MGLLTLGGWIGDGAAAMAGGASPPVLRLDPAGADAGDATLEILTGAAVAADADARRHIGFFQGPLPPDYPARIAEAIGAPGQEVPVLDRFRDPSAPWRLGPEGPRATPCPPDAICLAEGPSYAALVAMPGTRGAIRFLVTGEATIRHALLPRPGLLPADVYRAEEPVRAVRWTTLLACPSGALPVHARVLPRSAGLGPDQRRAALGLLLRGLRAGHQDCMTGG